MDTVKVGTVWARVWSARKAYVAAAGAVLAAVVPVFIAPGPFGAAEWINVGILAAGAVQVYNAGNLVGWRYAKAVAAGVAAGLVALTAVVSDGVTRAEAVQVLVAVAAAFGVWRVPNPTSSSSAAPSASPESPPPVSPAASPRVSLGDTLGDTPGDAAAGPGGRHALVEPDNTATALLQPFQPDALHPVPGPDGRAQ